MTKWWGPFIKYPGPERSLIMRSLVHFVVLACLLCSPVLAGDWPRKLKPALVWSENNSDRSTAGFARCSSLSEWEKTWGQHRPENRSERFWTHMDVDFESY